MVCGPYYWGPDLTETQVCARHFMQLRTEGCVLKCERLDRLWSELSQCTTWQRRWLWAITPPLSERCVALQQTLGRLKCNFEAL